ncbi:undecaprenyl-diphosphatase UppP [Helicobacter monodelphidis]|uniref:undecaprenyl-diphosphatase UppP n=1 Tax=Helicobacter sp. 15-1451 TaxID=2004995 RepID=UPI000DCE062E|nr:undecaprenyl-diphosphatase UppP [Helicobacter sp. 15-1451]RAX58145.1 undecaprenyl-diphosphatase UppP [Helicobacter sp. 15-1451]
MDIYHSMILGFVEGLTEFLPISSTAHMLTTAHLLDIDQQHNLFKNFVVVVQLGSILAVLVLFWQRFVSGLSFLSKLAIAFFPTGTVGFLFSDFLEKILTSGIIPYTLILGGFIFIIVEYLHRNKIYAIQDINSISYKQAFIIGCFQSLAMIPGVSRSGATIIGGLLLGFNRGTAAEFSFLLAFPTMLIASSYSIFKHHEAISIEYIEVLLVGMLVSFISALFAIKFFLNFISKFSFIPFGIYRILLGILLLYLGL